MKSRISKWYNKTYWFSDEDAWKIFRLGAFLEACTWLGLICAIIVRNVGLAGGDMAVSIAGIVHGAMLMIYCTLIAVLARSMEWGWMRIVMSFISGNIPLATLPLERGLARYRQKYPVRVTAPAGYEED